MNYAIVFRLLGYILMIEGTLLLLPAVTSLIYAEWAVMGVFLLTAAISAALGFALRTIKPRSKVFYMREGFAATSLCWILRWKTSIPRADFEKKEHSYDEFI
mgnify:CR=1 FL=1